MRFVRTAFVLAASHLAIASAYAADPATAAADAAAGDAGPEIVVLGRGQTRQTQEITQEDYRLLAPGSTPFKAIEKLPGVNFQSADPFGAYEWSLRISIRGFNQNQLGFTLDGVPLGDMSYGNANGLHVSRAISPENIRVTRVTQGAGAIGTASTNNLGGTIEFLSGEPAETAGLRLDLSGGSYDTIRGFVRADTGDLGGTGVRAFVSYAYLGLSKWKGFGEQRHHMVNAKAVAPIGPATLTAYFDFSDRRENDYQDLSLDIIDRLGLRNDNISNNFPLALQIAQVGANRSDTGARPTNPAAGRVYPAPFGTVDDVYYDAAGLRQDYLGYLRLDAPLGSAVKAQVTGYYHHNKGQGLWWTPYVPGTNGLQISVRTTEYDIHRAGVFGSLEWVTGPNTLRVGSWYENNIFRQARRFYNVDDPATIDRRDHLFYQRNPFFTQWFFRFDTDTVQVFVEDRLELGNLTLTAGFKGFDVANRSDPIVQGGLAAGEIGATDWFQPSAGAAYKLGDAELFAGFSQVTRAFQSAATAGPFATTVAGFQALNIKPETSDTYEAGLRYNRGGFSGVVAGYYIEFKNRLLAFRNGAGIVGNPAILSNVGRVESYGVEAAGQYKITRDLRFFTSYAHNVSTYRNNVRNAAGAIVSNIRGRTVVDSPEHIFNAELAYDDTRFFGRFGVAYQSDRFFTYENDQKVDGRALVDASLGFRVGEGRFRGLELQLSATNLFDEEYIATIGSNGFGDRGDNQTLLAGAPQQFLVTARKTF